MRIMTGFLSPTSGEVRIAERQFDPDSVELKRMIGYLPESAPAYGDMLAYDYLAYEARLHGFDPDTRVPEVVRLVGLDSHAHKPIRELSKGYRQRVGLAHTLIHDPEILVLDEPTSGLDPNQIIEVRALIRRIAETKTVILSTHIMQEVEALCSRVIVIHNGKIRYDGSITAFAGSARRIQLLVSDIELALLRERLTALPGFTAIEERAAGGDGGAAEAAPPLPGRSAPNCRGPPPTAAATGGDGGALRALTVVTDVDHDLRPAIFHAVAEAGGTIYEMVTERTSMEDIFHQLTGSDAVATKEAADV